jgi:Domain of unknown function (DUF1963)
MEALEQFREQMLESGIPAEEVQQWLRLARPCTALSTGGDGPVAAWLGGTPPDGLNFRFPFVASVDCAAIPPSATDLPLPADGTLLFFASPDGLIDGYPDAVEVLHLLPGSGGVIGGEALRISKHMTLPGEAESDPEHPHADELAMAWQSSGHYLMGSPPFRLGGYPSTWNYDPLESLRQELPETDPEDFVLLAEWSVDSDELDQGIVHWLIRREDLAQVRFDRVRGSADMVG